MTQQISPKTPNRQENYRFSPEELKALRECNNESFFQRSLPIGTVLGVGTFYAVKSGYFSGNARWGAIPKVALACTVGYFIGKVSYQRRCAEKIMQLPNSRLGQMLRQRRNAGTFQDSIDPGGIGSTTMTMTPFSGLIQDTYSDESMADSQGSLDLDTYRPITDGLDDTAPPAFDAGTSYEEEGVSQTTAKYTSYDDLRKKNREEYTSQKTALFRPQSDPLSQALKQPPSSPSAGGADPRPQGKRNQYGDIVD